MYISVHYKTSSCREVQKRVMATVGEETMEQRAARYNEYLQRNSETRGAVILSVNPIVSKY